MNEIKKLEQAIEALDAQRRVLGNEVVDAALAPLREQVARLRGTAKAPSQERRLVTVLFADITGSTEMGQGLEPEDILEVMEVALERLVEPVQRHGGRVTRYMGDGFKAVFGIPTAREDDALQAVRAGLGILAAARAHAKELAQTRSLHGFDVRVGVSTGTVATGGLSEAENTIMGLPVNLGARLESAAPPGGLLISEATYQQVGDAFEVGDPVSISAKGFDRPVSAYQVLRARPRTFRTVTRGIRGVPTRMVGRDAELQKLQELFGAAMSSLRMHLVTIVGEAGVGKSRLLYEFDRWLASSPDSLVALKGRAAQEMMSTPYGLLREVFAYLFGIRRSDPADLARRKLELGMAEYLADEAEMKAHYIGALLGYRFADSPHLVGVQGEARQLRDRALYYLTQFLVQVCLSARTVILLEDLHWADEPSLEAMTSIIRQSPDLRLMVVCATRPDFFERRPDWDRARATGEAPYARIDLQPLPDSASSELVSEILSKVDLLPETLERRIVEAADGNPFYVEELIKVLLHDGVILRNDENDVWHLNLSRLEALRVPQTLTALLQTRLDSLSSAEKTVLQQGSVFGRSFWGAALQHLQQADRPPVVELATLLGSDLVNRRSQSAFAHTDEYAFKHPLMRQTAYETLFKQVRVAYHRLAASWLVDVTAAAGRSDEYSAVIARHLHEAQQEGPAGQWYLRAADLASSQGAVSQARSLYEFALELLPDSDLELRWRARLGRAEALGILGDMETREADDALLVSLAKEIGDGAKLAQAYMSLGHVPRVRGDYEREIDAYEKALDAARRSGNRQVEARTLGLQVVALTRLGEMGRAAELADEALAAAEALNDDGTLLRNLTNVAVFYTEAGDIGNGAELLARQVEISNRLGNREGEIAGLTNLGYSYVQLGLHLSAVQALERSLDLSEAIGHRLMAAYARLNLGLARIRSGEPSSAEQILRRCSPDLAVLGDRFGQAACDGYLALALERSGALEAAFEHYVKAREAFSEIGVAGYANDASAGLARLHLARGESEQARQQIAGIWSCLKSEAAVGMEFPVLGYLTCAQVFQAVGAGEQARQALDLGRRYLVQAAERIKTGRWRASYLENIWEHRELRERWERLDD